MHKVKQFSASLRVIAQNKNIIAIGLENGKILMSDYRKEEKPLASFYFKNPPVKQIAWSTKDS